MANYDTDMTAAPQDDELLLLIPTGDEDEPFLIELGWWDETAGFGGAWVGAWREYDDAVNEEDPVAWARMPEVDAAIVEAEKSRIRARTMEPAN